MFPQYNQQFMPTYMQPQPQPVTTWGQNQQRMEIVRVNGENGARAFQLPPNSINISASQLCSTLASGKEYTFWYAIPKAANGVKSVTADEISTEEYIYCVPTFEVSNESFFDVNVKFEVLTPLSPPSELQQIPVAIREQSGGLCFHSR